MVPWHNANTKIFPSWGSLCTCGAGLFWALYIYFGHQVVQQNIGMYALTIAIGLSAFTLLPFGLWNNAPALPDTQYGVKR